MRSKFVRKLLIGVKGEGRGRARMLVRVRDNFTCLDCGKKRTPAMLAFMNKGKRGLKGRKKLFDVHHINGLCGKNSRGYDSTKFLDGMVTLCHKCHYNRHEHKCQQEGWGIKLSTPTLDSTLNRV